MSNIIGYARVFTLEQNAALQVDALVAAGAVRVFTDYASGATDDRPELAHALAYLNAGDTLAVWRIDRLGRSVANLIETVNNLAGRQVQFRSLTEASSPPAPLVESWSSASSPQSPRWNDGSSPNEPWPASNQREHAAAPADGPPS